MQNFTARYIAFKFDAKKTVRENIIMAKKAIANRPSVLVTFTVESTVVDIGRATNVKKVGDYIDYLLHKRILDRGYEVGPHLTVAQERTLANFDVQSAERARRLAEHREQVAAEKTAAASAA